MTIEERVKKLEQELKELKAGKTCVKVVRANKLIIEDRNGKSIAELHEDKCGVALTLHDEKGNPRAHLGISRQDYPTLALYDRNCRSRAVMRVTEEGPCMVLDDKKGHTRAFLELLKDTPRLVLSDEKGKSVVCLAP